MQQGPGRDLRFGGRRREATHALILAAGLALGGCRQDSVLTPIGPIGSGEKIILLDSVAIMLAIVIPTMIATGVIAWWFRASNARAKRDLDFVYSGRLELIVWSIPAVTVLFLGGLAWIGAHELDPAQRPASHAQPLEVQVVALDWKWLFIYPRQGVASVNRLVAPVGTPLRLRLTSASVMNTLFAPEVGSQIYAMNGMVATLWWQVDKPGVFAGRSNMFSGDGFPGMSFEIDAITPAQFAAWAAAAKGKGPTLDGAAYRALSVQSDHVRPYAYGAVTPGLFGQVVMQVLPPGPGPATAFKGAVAKTSAGGVS
jgi:cytochrome o ubiquinol oxidase subunit 2